MATYLSTIRFSDQGAKAIGQTTKRTQEVRTAAEQLGAQVKDVYWTLGDTDGLMIFDAPDDETAAALMVKVAAEGFVHTQTNRAFNAAEMDQLLAKAL